MATTYKGVAVWWGTAGDGTLTVAVGGVTQTVYANSVTVTRTAESKWIRNGQGATTAGVFHDPSKTVRFSGTPYSATRGASGATIAGVVSTLTPAPGTAVRMSVTSWTDDIDDVYLGDYVCTSATQNRTNTGELTIDLELIQFEDNNVSATVAT